MPSPKDPNRDNAPEDFLSAEDIRLWVEQEIKNARRALSLRVKELSDLTTAYSKGDLTPEQADEAHSRYYHRWGEALPGATAHETLSDQEILAQVDQARPFVGPRKLRELYQKQFKQDKSR